MTKGNDSNADVEGIGGRKGKIRAMGLGIDPFMATSNDVDPIGSFPGFLFTDNALDLYFDADHL